MKISTVLLFLAVVASAAVVTVNAQRRRLPPNQLPGILRPSKFHIVLLKYIINIVTENTVICL